MRLWKYLYIAAKNHDVKNRSSYFTTKACKNLFSSLNPFSKLHCFIILFLSECSSILQHKRARIYSVAWTQKGPYGSEQNYRTRLFQEWNYKLQTTLTPNSSKLSICYWCYHHIAILVLGKTVNIVDILELLWH